MNYGQHLAKKIGAWVEEGLISPYQAESIAAFETTHNRVGRKSIRRISWQLLVVFFVSLGGLMVLGSYWNAWLLPVRLLVLFVGIGLFECLAVWLLYRKEPRWLKGFLRGWDFSEGQRREVSAVVIWVTGLVGMLLISHQYPVSPPLWEMLSALVWVLLPLMIWLRSDLGSLLVGGMAVLGAFLGPSGYGLFLLFPYWLMPLFWHAVPSERGTALDTALYLIWMGCLAVVLWPFCHVFWYWPILGVLFYSAATLVSGRSRILLQGTGLALSLGWAVLAMWWILPFSGVSMGLLSVLLGLWLGWLLRRCLSYGSETIRYFLAHPLTAIWLFLLWTVILVGVQTLVPSWHAGMMFCHAGLALALAVRLTWTTDRLFRVLGLTLLVLVVGILLVQPIFPMWLRGTLMIVAGFGLWVFLRVRRDGGLSAATFTDAPHWEIGAGTTSVFVSRFFSKLSDFLSPPPNRFRWVLTFFLVLQLLLIGKPVLIYEWVRLTGDAYLMKASVQDSYSPFRGAYLQIRMIEFENPWPIVLPPGTRRGYLLLADEQGVLIPVALSEKVPNGLYLRMPVKGRSHVSTVTKTPFNRIFISDSERQSVLNAVKKDPRVWLHVKMKYGYCLLARITLGDKND